MSRLNKLKSLIVRIIGARRRLQLLTALDRCKAALRRSCSGSARLSSLYFLLFSRAFAREHHAVLAGQNAFARQRAIPQQSHALLRRNIHRLEKGLMMPQRKMVFAEDYIGETVQIYQIALSTAGFCRAELSWANNVLTAYFAVVTDTPLIRAARQQFGQLPVLPDVEAVPFVQAALPAANCSFEQLFSLCQRRHSVRWFLPKPVSRDLIENAVRLASEAPSACNRQPYLFYVLHGERAVAASKLAMGTVGFAENIPCLFVVVGDLSCYQEHRDRHLIYIDAALASMQLMLGLEAQGLASCPINWPDIESREQQMQQLLQLPIYQRPVMLVATGYADPAGQVAYSQKKSPELLIRE